jgi:VanZ family protein
MTALAIGQDDGAAPFARISLLVYTLLILYASWYPFAGWQATGLSSLAYLTAPLPHYWTAFDALTNILAYIPLGFLAVLALHPRFKGMAAVGMAVLFGALLTGVIEAAQTFLPSRVSSNLDFYCNITGALTGAVLGHASSDAFLKHSRLLELRRRWFLPEAGFGIILLGLWPLAQIYPQEVLFGLGQFATTLSAWLSAWLSSPIDIADLFMRGEQLTVEQYWLYETIVTTCGLTGTVLILLFLLRRSAPKTLLAAALIIAALTAKSLANALFFSPENAFSWLTPGARGGILLALMMLSGLAFARPAAQRRIAITALLISVIIVNIIPVNPYFTATLQTWAQGKFLNFNGAAQFLSVVWPFAALWYLIHLRRSAKQR